MFASVALTVAFVVVLFFAMDWNAILLALMPILQTVLPGLIVTLVAGIVKKYAPMIPGKWITVAIVPFIAFLLSVVASLTVDANVWTGFVLGLVGTFFFELKKQLTAPV